MAVSSYLPETAGGTVVAAEFPDEAAASVALDLLRASGVRYQDIAVIHRDGALAERIAGDRAWAPSRGRGGLFRRLLPGQGLPATLRRRYRDALRGGSVIVAVAEGGQPADTVAALFAQAQGGRIETWWQGPSGLFAPPELAGPF